MDLGISEEFKQMRIEPSSRNGIDPSIFQCPTGWKKAKLEETCSLRKETINPIDVIDNLIYIGLEHIVPGKACTNKWGSPNDVRSSKNKFHKDDVLYGKLRPYLDKAIIAHQNGICSTDILVLRPNNKRIISHFLVNILHKKEFIDHAISTTSGVNHPRTSWSAIKNFELCIPELYEQQRIAYVLSAVQVARDKTQAVIEAAREMKKSLMKHLFTYGPVPVAEVGKVQLKETEIGIIPEHWEVKKLGDIASNIRSGSTPRGGSTTYLDKGIPLIRSQNVLMNNLVLDDVAYVSKETHETMLRSQIQPGDVLLNITGASIGRVAIAPSTLKEANVNQHVCRIRPKEELISEFLSYYLASEIGQWQIMSTQIGATRQGLNYQQVRSFSLPVPHLEEQAKIVEALAAIDLKVHAEEMHMTALDTLFKTLIDNLMTAKIRVNHLEMAQ